MCADYPVFAFNLGLTQSRCRHEPPRARIRKKTRTLIESREAQGESRQKKLLTRRYLVEGSRVARVLVFALAPRVRKNPFLCIIRDLCTDNMRTLCWPLSPH